MKKITKLFAVMLVMVMVFTGVTSTVTEAKTTKTSITVTNKSTGKKIGKKLTLTKGKKLQLKVKYGKTNVTKKAKYKASNKNVTISKKGKITAKKVGTTTVTIKYKKKTKKIKVTVKVKSTVSNETTNTTNDSTTEDKSDVEQNDSSWSKAVDADEYIKLLHQNQTAPHPECDHEWKVWFYSDTGTPDVNTILDTFMLDELICQKCGTIGYCDRTIPAREALNYTNEELTQCIQYYRLKNIAVEKHHKHIYKWMWTYNENTGRWSGGRSCELCGVD